MGVFRLAVIAVAITIGSVQQVLADAAAVMPNVYSEPGLAKQRHLTGSPDIPDHVDPFGGSLDLAHVDLVVPGNGGLDIKIERHYTSNIWLSRPYLSPANYPNMLLPPTASGAGWSMDFGRVVLAENSGNDPCATNANVIGDDVRNNPVLELPDGSMQILYVSATGVASFITKSYWLANCYGNHEGLTVYSPDGLKYTMNHLVNSGYAEANYTGQVINAWYPTRIEDAKGNYLTITYTTEQIGSHAEISAIDGSDGRHVQFTWQSGVPTQIQSGYSGNQIWKYAYVSADGSHQLLKTVTRPDGKTWVYDYYSGSDPNAPYALRKVTNPYGVTVEYVYGHVDFEGALAPALGQVPWYSTAVISRTITMADGNTGVWTYAYQPGTDKTIEPDSANQPFNWGPNDVTVVTTPVGTETYYHYGQQRLLPFAGGYAVGTDLQLWKIGILAKKVTSANGVTRTETYSWSAPYALSTEINYFLRFSFDEPNVAAPVMDSKVVSVDNSDYTTTYTYGIQGDPRPSHISESGQAMRNTDITWFPLNPSNAVWLFNEKVEEDYGANNGEKKLRQYDWTTGEIQWQSILGQYEEYTYTTQGDVQTKKNGRGKTWTYNNYYRGIPLNEIQPFLTTTSGATTVSVSRTVNDTGTIASETDALQHTTNYTYDAMNRISGITKPIGTPISVDWDSGCTVGPCYFSGRTVTRGGYQEITRHDGLGRVLCVDTTDGSNHVTKQYRYDILGRKTYESYPYAGTCPTSFPSSPPTVPGDRFEYDVLGRVTKITHADNTYRTYQYRAGNQEVMTDERGFATLYSYRSFGDPANSSERVLMRVDAREGANSGPFTSTVFDRNVLGQVLAVTQGNSDGTGITGTVPGPVTNGITRTYDYDPNTNYLLTVTNPETGTTTFTRDGVGNMKSRTVGASGTTTYGYDDQDRLLAVDFPGATLDVVKNYYANGLLHEQVTRTLPYVSGHNFSSDRIYTYDENDNLKTEALTVADVYVLGTNITPLENRTLTAGYSYNLLDQLDTITYPSGRLVSFAPSALGRPSQVSPFVSSVSYYPGGQPSTINYANGTRTDISLNNRQWTDHITTSGLVDLGYTYDGVGNVKTITDGINSTYSQTLDYDGLDRLTTANGVWGSGSMTYDAVGNLRTKVLGSQSLTYSYDTANRLGGVSGSVGYSFGYDVYGNVITNGSNLFTYDDAGNMTFANGNVSAIYVYDASNMRVREQKGGAVNYDFYTKSGMLLGEYDQDGIHFKEYAYLGSKLIAMVANLPNQAPVASIAPISGSVNGGATVTLDGSASADPDGGAVTYQWTQTGGTTVTISNAGSAIASFVAPQLAADAVLTFSLTVTDIAGATTTANVSVTVLGTAPPVAVTGLFATPGNGQVTLGWLPQTVISGGRAETYNVYWNATPGVTKVTGNKIANVTSPFVHASLNNGASYYYIVTAVNAAGESVESKEVLVVPGMNQWGTSVALVSGALDARVGTTTRRYTSNAAGQGIVTWTQTQGNQQTLWALRMDANGVQYAPTMLDTTPVSNYSIDAYAAIDPTGRAVVVWAAGGDVHAATMTVQGQWSSPTILSTTKYLNPNVTGDRHSNYVAMDPNGNAIAVWMENGANSQGVGYAYVNLSRYDASSGRWSTPEQVASEQNGWVHGAQLMVDDAGNTMVAWEWVVISSGAPADGGVRVRRFNAGIGQWENPEDLRRGLGFGGNSLILVSDRSGNNIAVWEDFIAVSGFPDPQPVLQSRRYDVVSGWDPVQTVAGPWGNITLTPDDYSLAADPNGNAMLVWSEEDANAYLQTIHARRYVVGTGWENPVVVGDRHTYIMNVNLFTPRVSLDNNGNAVVAWYTWRDWNATGWTGEGVVWANHYVPGTGWIGAYDIRRCTDPINCSDIEVVSRGNGQAMAIWTEGDSSGTANSLMARPYTWFGPTFLSQNHPPMVTSGDYPTVNEGGSVTLSGSVETDQDGTIVDHQWVQIWGPDVTLQNSHSSTPTFVAPQVTGNQTLIFIETVIDNLGARNSEYWEVYVNDIGGPIAPTAPATVTAPAVHSTGSFTISWAAAVGTVTAYEVYQATDSSFSNATLVYSGLNTSAVLSGVAPGTYYYRVRACNGLACSIYTVAAVVTSIIAPNGDLNGDGVVDVADVLLAERFALGLATPTESQLAHADVAPAGNPDGIIDVSDVIRIRRKALGLETF